MTAHIQHLFVSAATNRGLTRPTNEDTIIVGEWLGYGDMASHSTEHCIGEQGVLLAVADGLGGHQAGEVASRFIIVT